MKQISQAMSLSLIAAAALALLCAGPAFAQTQTRRVLHDAAMGKLRPARLPVPIVAPGNWPESKRVPFISPGTLVAAEQALKATSERGEGADLDSNDAGSLDLGQSPGTIGCGQRTGSEDLDNKRVNQDCTFRRQAEEKIVFNPANPQNLIAGQNDSRLGFNQCGIAFSTDNGVSWGDLLPPFRQKVNNPQVQTPTGSDPNRHTIQGDPGTFHTYDAGSDPAPAFDSLGRGFFSCVAFDVFSNASMVYVAQSPLGAQGSFFLNIPTFSRRFIVVEDNNPGVLHDKEFITADTFASSPNRDNVYTTWTVFVFDDRCINPQFNPGGLCSAAIFGSMSTNHGVTWSTPEEISGRSASLCFFGNFFDPTRKPNDCDLDQGSDPIVLPNGNLEVIFNNGNTAANNPNAQQLGVHCAPSGSSPAGTARLNCSSPVKVGDDVIVGEPLCDFGRGPEECVPGPFIRTNDFPRIAINRANGHLFATWQDYRNGEYDVELAVSVDGGSTWSPSVTLNPDRGLDHYMPAIAVAERAAPDRVGDSYFRSERVPNENFTPPGGFAPGQPGVQQANSDYVLAGGTSLAAPFNFLVVSPVFRPPDGIQAGFNGDYSGLTINQGAEAHPIWSDTRNVDPFAPLNGVLHDEDIFTTARDLPNGIGTPSVGQVGQR
jgi:hypothetical protein